MPTDKIILRVKLIALGVFTVLTIGLVAYTFLYAMPSRKCEARGRWWSNNPRGCYAPIYLPAVTGRKPGEARQIRWPTVNDPQRTASAPKAEASSASSPPAGKP